MRFCDSHPNITKWASENVKIPYRHPFTGKITNYVPDFMVQYTDKNGKTRVDLIEIKPKAQTLQEKARDKYDKASLQVNAVKWEAAQAWCKAKGLHFKVITEDPDFPKQSGRKTQTYIINNNMKIEYTKTPRDVVEFDDDVPANLDPTDIVEIFQTS